MPARKRSMHSTREAHDLAAVRAKAEEREIGFEFALTSVQPQGVPAPKTKVWARAGLG